MLALTQAPVPLFRYRCHVTEITQILPPVAIADATPISGTVPLTVQFDGAESYDPQGGALLFAWNFGDQSQTSIEVSPTHTYTTTGTFVAILRVIDDLGQSALDTVQITVSAPDNQAPVASPTASPNSGPAPLAVAFAANASDLDGDALTYAWDFADGATSTVADPSHVFTGAGTYNVSVTVSDGQEQTTEYVTGIGCSP